MAIIGITLAIAILGIVAGEKFFLDLMDGVVFLVEAISFLVNNIVLNYLHYIALMDGVVFLVEGILLVIYNIFLLNTVKKNEASQVFQDHQSGLHNVALRLADLEYRSVSDLPDCRICINSPSERRAWQSGLPGNFQNGCPPRYCPGPLCHPHGQAQACHSLHLHPDLPHFSLGSFRCLSLFFSRHDSQVGLHYVVVVLLPVPLLSPP